MSDEQNKPEENTWKAITRRPIKEVSTSEIEDAISKALADLTGRAYDVTIEKIDFNNGLNSSWTDTSRIEMSVTKTSELGGLFGKTTETE